MRLKCDGDTQCFFYNDCNVYDTFNHNNTLPLSDIQLYVYSNTIPTHQKTK